jgi:hypothetical protein
MGRRRLVAGLFVLAFVATVMWGKRSADFRGDAFRAAKSSGLAGRQPAIIETAGMIESAESAGALIAEAMLDESERAPARRTGGRTVEPARAILVRAIAARPASAHYRFLLGRSAVPVEGGSMERWERPLELAAQAAPGLGAAAELLASRFLLEWPRLDPSARARGMAALRRAFSDPSRVGRLFPETVAALGPDGAVGLLSDDSRVLGAALDSSRGLPDGRAARILMARMAALRGRPDPSS